MSEIPDLSTLMQMMNEIKSKANSDADANISNDNETVDMETMMKIAKMMSAMNSSKNNAETNLLYALKPFLRDEKKEKVEQYAQVLKMSTMFHEMNQSGGSSK